jgi:hypothetical protein
MTNFWDFMIAFVNAWSWKKVLVLCVAALLVTGIIHVGDIVRVFQSVHFK